MMRAMPAEPAPQWRKAFDAVERELSPRLEAVVRSDRFADAVGVAAQIQRAFQRQASRNTRRVLHMLNLPAGTDVSRLLTEIGRLQEQVRDLQRQLGERDH
jgi:hypothetical protein